MRRTAFLFAVPYLVLSADVALAQPPGTCPPSIPIPIVYPPACQSDEGKRGYEDGWETGNYVAQWAWDSFKGCGDDFGEKLIATLKKILDQVRPPEVDDYPLCRVGGYFDAVAVRVADFLDCCANTQCCPWGTDMGVIYAMGYCLIAIATGGGADPGDYFRPAVDECGHNFELCCDRDFVHTAWQDLECRPYTAAPYAAVFYHFQHKVCAYHPKP